MTIAMQDGEGSRAGHSHRGLVPPALAGRQVAPPPGEMAAAPARSQAWLVLALGAIGLVVVVLGGVALLFILPDLHVAGFGPELQSGGTPSVPSALPSSTAEPEASVPVPRLAGPAPPRPPSGPPFDVTAAERAEAAAAARSQSCRKPAVTTSVFVTIVYSNDGSVSASSTFRELDIGPCTVAHFNRIRVPRFGGPTVTRRHRVVRKSERDSPNSSPRPTAAPPPTSTPPPAGTRRPLRFPNREAPRL